MNIFGVAINNDITDNKCLQSYLLLVFGQMGVAMSGVPISSDSLACSHWLKTCCVNDPICAIFVFRFVCNMSVFNVTTGSGMYQLTSTAKVTDVIANSQWHGFAFLSLPSYVSIQQSSAKLKKALPGTQSFVVTANCMGMTNGSKAGMRQQCKLSPKVEMEGVKVCGNHANKADKTNVFSCNVAFLLPKLVQVTTTSGESYQVNKLLG